MDIETLSEDEIALVSGGGEIPNPPAPGEIQNG